MGGLSTLPDQELVRRALAERHGPGGRYAASVLLERHQERVYIWCLRLVRDHATALELAQETLVNAYRGLESFEGRSGFSSWLFSIARNRCLSALRRPSPFMDEEGLDEVVDPRPGPEERHEARADEETVLDLVRRHLDPVEQEALWLRCYEGLPVDEITRLLGLDAASGARALLQRARRKLRAALKQPSGGGTARAGAAHARGREGA